VAGLSGGGVGSIEVEVTASGHGGYLIMSVSSASWAAEVAWWECIRLCSSDASRGHCVAGLLFVGVVGSFCWPLVRRFRLPGGLQTAARIS
jgi:hypothetical protein